MNWLLLAALLLLPGTVKADDHVNEALCDEVVTILREFRQYTTLTPAQVHALAGNCYGEVDQINEESGGSSNAQKGAEDT